MGELLFNAGMDMPLAPPEADPSPCRLLAPDRQSVPVLFASAHSGRDYPADFIAAARLDAQSLRRSEDCFVDELFACAPAYGAPLLAANFPRALCDANREAWELDPTMFTDPLPGWVNTSSARVGAGLGTIARVVATGAPIYAEKLPFAEAERRVHSYWEPYHAALGGLIAATRQGFGACLLIDCHSMPASLGRGVAARGGQPAPDLVLGDAHGTSCAPAITLLAEQFLRGLGYVVRRNDPYAGGYVTRHYGRPHQHVHALQIEISRALYLDEERLEKLPRFARFQAHIAQFVQHMTANAADLLGR